MQQTKTNSYDPSSQSPAGKPLWRLWLQDYLEPESLDGIPSGTLGTRKTQVTPGSQSPAGNPSWRLWLQDHPEPESLDGIPSGTLGTRKTQVTPSSQSPAGNPSWRLWLQNHPEPESLDGIPSGTLGTRKITLLASKIFSASLTLASLNLAPSASAQIIPDTTLNQNTRVEAGCTTCFIEGGTTVGTTLFHSFEEFSIPTGSRAFFVNATDISDIISRVTGDSVSNIDGRIDVDGTANLFLLNPNGVIFGPNATLSIGGSFLATTADRFEFANGRTFDSINPEPAPVSLTVSTPIGLQFGANPGAIAIEGSTLIGSQNQTLALVGGPLTISDADIRAIPGQIELGSVGANGAIVIEAIAIDAIAIETNATDANEINTNENSEALFLNYADTDTFQDIELTQDSDINASGDEGGRIQIQGNQIIINQDSQIQVNASENSAGEIYIQAAESLEIIGRRFDPATGVFNIVSNSASADADNGILRLEAPSIILRNGAEVSTNTEGRGQGARLEVIADEILLDGGLKEGDDSTPSGFFARATAEAGADAVGGVIVVEGDRLTIQNGGQISSDTNGVGQAGNIILKISEQLEVVGRLEADLTLASGIFAQVAQGATGDGGTITINTPNLTVTGGAQISTAARSGGAGGDIFIGGLTTTEAQRVLLSGTANINRDDNISGILVSAEEGASKEADAGSLTLNAAQLIVEEGARISADNRGAGQGGSATLNVQELIVRNEGQILAASFADNPDEPGFDPAIATSGGNAGSLTIDSRTLSLSNSGEISVRAEAEADAGTIDITVATLDILDSTISASAEEGIAGSITITTTESEVFVSGPDAAIAVEATGVGGQAGDLIVNTDLLEVSNGATLSVSAPQGTAGNLEIGATTVVLDSGRLEAETQQTPAGETGANIEITGLNILFLTNDSLISARALDQADGGNVTLDASQGFITAPADTDSDILANAFEGDGGEISITTQGLFGLQERPESAPTNDLDATSETGVDGTVAINRIEVDPSRGLVALPSSVVDVSRLIAQQCNAGGYAARQRSDFVITGRGGLVPAPGDLVGQSLWDDMRYVPGSGNSTPSPPSSLSHSPTSPLSHSPTPPLSHSPTPPLSHSPTLPLSHSPTPPLSHSPTPPLSHSPTPIEAQTWTHTSNGHIQLLAQTAAPPQIGNSQWQTVPTCTRSR